MEYQYYDFIKDGTGNVYSFEDCGDYTDVYIVNKKNYTLEKCYYVKLPSPESGYLTDEDMFNGIMDNFYTDSVREDLFQMLIDFAGSKYGDVSADAEGIIKTASEIKDLDALKIYLDINRIEFTRQSVV